jgi:hypothetical protein
MTSLEQKAKDPIEHQVTKLVEVIQQLQQRVVELELHTIPQSPQEVCDQQELTAQSAIERIKTLATKCKQISSRSAQIYEQLSEDPELKKLESQLQEAKQQDDIVQAQLKLLSPIERMKRSQEQCTSQQLILTMQNRVMEVTQKLQPIQEVTYLLFEEIEGQGTLLEQVVATVEQQLEGPISEVVVQEFVEQEAIAQRQVEVAQAKLETFEANLPRPECLRMRHR